MKAGPAGRARAIAVAAERPPGAPTTPSPGRRPFRAGVLAGLAALGVAASPAAAQFFRRSTPQGDPPCVLDKCLGGGDATAPTPAPPPAPAPEGDAGGFGPVAPGPFDFYVLALSWSPGFCDTEAGARQGGGQCAPGAGLGFVVHGLWPQNTRGYPADCDGPSSPGRAALEIARGLYPSTGLAVHEWRKHGACTGLSPTAYFTAVRRARAAITIPPALQRPDEPQTMTPADIARAFAAINPGLRPGSMAVTCRGGALQEVRLCLSKDLRGFTACPEVARAGCRSGAMSVLPVQ